MKKFCTTTLLALACSAALFAQHSFPRLFVDIPVIAIGTPNVEKAGNLMGASAETAFNFAAHWFVTRVGGGAGISLDPKSKELKETVVTTPYALFEAGLGKYRSNGNNCAITHANAFTAMAKAGIRYNFKTDIYDTPTAKADPMDFTVGAEFGYFFLRDVFKNYEFFLDGNYHVRAEVISARLGFKLFLNLRADMSGRY